MKVKVTSVFKDVYTDEVYPVGKTLEDITKERYEEIKDFVEIINNSTKNEKAELKVGK